MSNVSSNRFIRFADLIAIITVLILCAAIFSANYYMNKHPSDDNVVANVYLNNEIIKTINLSSVDAPYKINLDSNPKSVINVEKGRIRYESSECPDQICVKTGWLFRNGQSAVCIPAKTMVIIEASPKSSDPDIISY